MCGISGILNFNDSIINSSELLAFTKSVSHRGPDGLGVWIHEKSFLGLGHTRLSILDLSDFGNQPMSFSNNRFRITFNGEIFNFLEIREYLVKQGFDFISDADTEVILAAYQFWGKDCLNQFNGMWAFAIWDDLERELFLARDHFGIKPLYYLHQNGERIVFGSETLQFKYLDNYTRTIDNEHLSHCIKNPFSLEAIGETIFSNIKSVLPGHYISIKNNELKEVKWWNTMDFNIDIPSNYLDQVECFKELFFDSCKLRLRSDVPIASALSGGLDSSSVYSTLHTLNKDNLGIIRKPRDWQKAFVASFPNTEQDETEFAKSVIDNVSGDGVFWQQNEEDLISDIINYTKKFDAVYSTPIHVVSKIYEEMRQMGILVSMDGHGVDEMLFGYPGLQLEAAKESINRGDFKYAGELMEIYVNMFPENQREQIRGELIKLASKGNNLTIKNLISIKYKKSINKILKYNNRKWLNPSQGIEKSFHVNNFFESPTESKLFQQFHFSPLPTILRNFDKASMMSGVEIRMPFMDHRLVSYVFKLPLKSKLNNGYTKLILRDAMKGIIPENVRTRTIKTGFNAPLNNWMRTILKPYILETLNQPNFKQQPYWNYKIITKDVEDFYKYNKKIDIILLWRILNTHIILNDK